MKRISIIGTGFAALTAVRTLRKHDKNCQITVIAPDKALHYLPSLIWIPSGIRKPQDLVIPLDHFFKRMNVQYHQGEATGLRNGGRILDTNSGELPNDGLIIASGAAFINKLPGIEHAILPCKSVGAAEQVRDRLKQMQTGHIAIGFSSNPNEPTAMRGGPMFEFLFGIDTQLKKEKRREKFTLHFFSPAPKPGIRLGERAYQGIMDEISSRGIIAHTGHKLKAFTEKSIITEAEEFDAEMILFMPGLTGHSWFDNTELPRSKGGLVKADKHCKVRGFDRLYVAGDSGSFPGPDWQPKQAHMADLQAKAAAVNLLAEMNAKPIEKTFKNELLCIVDDGDKGIMVSRNEKTSRILPSSSVFHWSKKVFEKIYLHKYR